MAERRFTEKETSLILRKAVMIQAKAAQEQNAPAAGYSLSELEAAAKDAGLNPELLEKAISELGLDGSGSSRSRRGPLRAFVGSPWNFRVEIPLDALPDRETLENLLIRMNEICRAVGTGAVGTIGLAWDMNYAQTSNSGIRMSVRVQSKAGGGAAIAVSADISSMGGGIFGGMGGGLSLGLGMGAGIPIIVNGVVSPLFVPFVLGGIIGGSYLLSRLAFGYYSRKTDKATRRIADEIRYFIERKPGP